MLTYDHASFVEQAVASVLAQEAPFRYELVIGEDCSSDGTRNVVTDLQARYPDRIRVLLPQRNLGMHANFLQTLAACRGEYIALLEGDDYWTASRKLVRQVELLESHPEYAICFHDARIERNGHVQRDETFGPAAHGHVFDLTDLLSRCFIPTCSAMFRRGLVSAFPDWMSDLGMLDWPLFILNAQYGKIVYVPEAMAVYRIHGGGTWSSRKAAARIREEIKLLGHVNRFLECRYEDQIRRELEARWLDLAGCFVEQATDANSATASMRQLLALLDASLGDAETPRALRRKALGHFYLGLAFAAQRTGDLSHLRRYLLSALLRDSKHFANRGVWSLGMEACLGGRVAATLRRKRKAPVRSHALGAAGREPHQTRLTAAGERRG
jgi:glycosyltransferase involved in cell wall biosynthesis